MLHREDKNNIMTQFTRTFHPVGQGAFYSEEHQFENGENCTIVYDCGSTSSKVVKARMGSDLSSKDVDILFISHFHKDHISGIKYLNPKKIIIPYMDEYDIVLALVKSKIDGEDFDANMKATLQKDFPNATIVEVRKVNIENDSYGQNVDTRSDLVGEIDSGIPIEWSEDNAIDEKWLYIPYNFDNQAKKFAEKIAKELAVDCEDFKQHIQTYLKNRAILSKIKKIYEQLGGLNESSLILVSACRNEESPMLRLWRSCYCSPFCLFHELREYYSGCIYTGDITISQELVRSLSRLLQQAKLAKKIQTLQIPHHGSSDSYNPVLLDILKVKPTICIISVGETNTYGHPSAKVIQDIIHNNHYVHLVTEHSSSMFMEIGRY